MIKLRRIEQEDLGKMRSWRNNPEIKDWCRQVGLLSMEDQENWFKMQTDDKSMRMFAIMENDTTQLIGVCGLTSIDYVIKRAEFSCYIAPALQRRGFATETLRDLFNFGFNELNLNLIWGETFDGNPAIHLFHKLGMVTEGTRRQFYYKNGKYLDAHLISLLRCEWKPL